MFNKNYMNKDELDFVEEIEEKLRGVNTRNKTKKE